MDLHRSLEIPKPSDGNIAVAPAKDRRPFECDTCCQVQKWGPGHFADILKYASDLPCERCQYATWQLQRHTELEQKETQRLKTIKDRKYRKLRRKGLFKRSNVKIGRPFGACFSESIGKICREPEKVTPRRKRASTPIYYSDEESNSRQTNTQTVNNTLTSRLTETYNVSPVRATAPARRLEVTRVEKVNVNRERDAVNNRSVQPVHADTSAAALSKRFESTGNTVALHQKKKSLANTYLRFTSMKNLLNL